MTNQSSVKDLENKCQSLFSDLVKIQNEIRKELISHADGKNLKGNELVGWLGEIYGKLLFNGKLVDDSEEHDFIFGEGFASQLRLERDGISDGNERALFQRLKAATVPRIYYLFT